EKSVFLVLSGRLVRQNKLRLLWRDTLTVTALDLAALRMLSAWLINTSFSFNGAGASRQPSKVPFIWVIYGSSLRSTQGTADPVHITVCRSTPGLGKINRAIWEK
ncbi:hypothetical protein XENOCAPTIV_002235, partial [Xenoophorus captivus]